MSLSEKESVICLTFQPPMQGGSKARVYYINEEKQLDRTVTFFRGMNNKKLNVLSSR
jgi:hypothetical protein